MRRVKSLKGRLLLLSLLFLPLLLILVGISLDQAFTRSLLASQLERLKVQVYLVLGALDFDDKTLEMPASLTEPRYNQLNSGLYALISEPGGRLLWRSPSSLAIEWDPEVFQQSLGTGQSWFESVRLGGRDLFAYRLAVIWEHREGEETSMVLTILEDQAAWQAEVSSYRTYLWSALTGIAVAWFLLLLVLIRWGLRPLDRLAGDLEKIEQGQQQHLEGDYPTEVQQLTTRLNQLIHAERQQRERYRNTLADLAHSLKTPLALMRGLIGQGLNPASQNELEAQVTRMDQIIGYQLQRAVMAADQRLLQSLPVEPMLQRLLATLDKVYRNKQMRTSLIQEAELQFLGDERDFLEVFGNILDNAYKYGRSQVQVRVCSNGGANARLCIQVDDDGPGIDPQFASQVTRRGVRADQIQPGQGIGLAVAVDILQSYQGSLRVDRSPLGGARVEVELNGV